MHVMLNGCDGQAILAGVKFRRTDVNQLKPLWSDSFIMRNLPIANHATAIDKNFCFYFSRIHRAPFLRAK